MGGFFSRFDTSKPGPGVEKNEKPRPRILQFLIEYQKKFYKLLHLNLIYFLFSIPALVLSQYISFIVFQFIPENFAKHVQNWQSLSLLVVGIPIIAVGPACAGLTYILRNFARGDQAFIWQDFKENSRKNFKQSMIISLINIAAFFFLAPSISWYLFVSKKSAIMSILIGVQALILLIVFMMNLYIYPLMVTFDLKIKDIYKNALIFALIKFIPNLVILLVCALIAFGVMYNFIVGFVLMPIFSLAIIGFITNFYVYPTIKKYLMKPSEE